MSEKNNIEDRTRQLNEILAWFDSEDFAVEEAMDKFKAAETLAESIKQDLLDLKNEINVLKKKFSE